MTRNSDPAHSRNDPAQNDPVRDDPAMSVRRERGPEEIEQDIRNIRSRMDTVLDEIEYRLSPGQITGGAAEILRDVIDGRPTRLSRAIRANPWPLALIGAGALWLAWNVSRTPDYPGVETGAREGFKDGGLITGHDARVLLTGLVGACRQGADGFRRADRSLDDPILRVGLDQVASQLDRSAVALESELRRRDGPPVPGGPFHPEWYDLEPASGVRPTRDTVFSVLEHGIDGTLELFRVTLHENLPEDLRVVVGAHFHEIETARHKIGALREAVA